MPLSSWAIPSRTATSSINLDFETNKKSKVWDWSEKLEDEAKRAAGKPRSSYFDKFRIPLFSEDDGDDDCRSDNLSLSFSRTPSLEPSFLDSPSSPSSLPLTPSPRHLVPSYTSRDPLLSPPSPDLKPIFTSTDESLYFTPSKRATVQLPRPPAISLLTRSLNMLQKLPNLALSEGVESRLLPEWTGLNNRAGIIRISGELILEEKKFAPSPIKLSTFSMGEYRRLSQQPSVDDLESTTAIVQLQTFSPPPISSKKIRIPIVSPPSTSIEPLVPRLISNPQHLLMLSLEFTMIKRHKITSPLRNRSFIVRNDKRKLQKSGLSFQVV